jgi:glycosyltransferase involved in cell wall biosynthesis
MSLRILIATHAPADRRTAVYRCVSDRASHLRSVGCKVDVLSRDDLAHSAWARLDPLLLPILLAARDLSGYDVLIFHSYLGWAFHSLRRWFDPARRMTTITWFHGLEPLYHRAMRDEYRRQGRELSWRFRLLHETVMPRLLKRSCRASDAVFCFNSIEAGYLAAEGWAEPHRVRQVSNGVEPECFLPRRHHDVARRLLFVGQWLPAKGIRYLVDAFTSLAALGDVELACVGTGTAADDVLAMFPAAVRPRVSVFAHVDRLELYEQLARADLFVFPSLSEGFSCALLEAMAASMPVVATRVGAAVDLLDDGRNGVLVPGADSSAIVAAVTRLAGDVRTRTVLGEAARRTASGYTSEAAGTGFAIKVLDVVARRGGVERRQPVLGSDAVY